MPKYRECARLGCQQQFDYADHPQQQFCSKSCAKKGTQHRHAGAEAERPGGMAAAIQAVVEQGMSYRQAGQQFGLPASSIHVAVQRLRQA